MLDQTIEGRGFVGQNNTVFTIGANGLINANVTGQTLLLDPGATAADGGGSFLNEGNVRASNGGTLTLTGAGGGDFTNNGTFEALNGSVFNMISGSELTNISAGVLSGGTYRVVDSGGGATMSLLGSPISTIAANATVELSGANSNLTFSGTALSTGLQSNQGTLRIADGRVFSNVNSLTNAGTLDLRGGTFSSPTMVNGNNGLIIGYGNVNVRPGNSGAVVADGGTLVFSNGISAAGGSSSITVNSGAALDISAGANSGTATLAHNGTDLNLGNNNILVSFDYTNANFGVGNTFDHRANVTGTGDILATGNTAQEITGDVVANTISFGNVHVGDVVTKNYQIANTGTTGPSLRGAIQTAVNGGNITDSRLGGAGATAGSFGPIATGADSGDLGVTFNATSAGAITGQTIHIENNFDNVAGSDIAITGAAYRLAEPTIAPTIVDFGIIHVGDTVSQSLLLGNAAPADGFSESLDASFASATSGVNAAGSVSGLAAGGSDAASLSVSVDTSSAQVIDGTAFLMLVSDGFGTSGLGTTELAGAEIAVIAQVNNFAAPSFILQSGAATLRQDDATSFTLDFGTVLQNSGSPTANLLVANDVLGPADTLAAVFELINASDFDTSGFVSFSGLEAGDSQGGFTVGIDTSALGALDGSIFLDGRSQNASGFDGALDRVTLNLRGVVAVPEPSSSLLVAMAAVFALGRRRRSHG